MTFVSHQRRLAQLEARLSSRGSHAPVIEIVIVDALDGRMVPGPRELLRWHSPSNAYIPAPALGTSADG